MTGHRPFARLREKMTPAQRKTANERAASLRAEMTLAELRQARKLTQETLAGTLNVGQEAIAKMEKRADMYVSSLRRYVGAMGGELEIVARFPDGRAVTVTNFSDLGEVEPTSKRKRA
jgi:DNA-binding XRE family transcriptional regulator